MTSGTLFGPKGKQVKALEGAFADWQGAAHAIAASSGTAAIHTALNALALEPGDEVITTSVTDIGALTPILYEGAIPVFADVDARTGNLTAESVAQKLSDRTKAAIVTHLLGNPADTPSIAEAAPGVPILEDCAQSFGATLAGPKVGTTGAVSCFSLQQGKHITAGEGGLIATDDAVLAKRMKLYVNKAWDYDQPSDHDFLALNYRMTELQAAVARAQLVGLDDHIDVRQTNAQLLGSLIDEVDGVEPIPVIDGATSSYWRYGVLVDPDVIPGGNEALAAKLRSVEVPAASRYIKKPAFQTNLFQNQTTFGNSRWPFTLARPEALDYSPDLYPGTFSFLDHVVVLPWNERLDAGHIQRIGEAIRDGVAQLVKEAA